jgi:hypothetical protein
VIFFNNQTLFLDEGYALFDSGVFSRNPR